MIDEPANQYSLEQIACEVCNCKHGTAINICDECDKGCLPHSLIPEEHGRSPRQDGSVTTAIEQAFKGQPGTDAQEITNKPGESGVGPYVSPTWEPESNIPEDLTTAWKAEMQQQQPARRKRPYADCTDLEKQGIHGWM
jgi:hypothetical protein